MRTQAEICNHDWFGDLPEGWEMKPLKNLFSFSKGLSITKNDLTEAGKSVISYGQIHSKNYFGTGIVNDIIRHVSDAIGKNNNSALVNTGGFVFADTSEDLAGVGNCAYNDLEKTIYGGYHTIVLNPRYESDNKYLAYQFRTDAWRLQLRRQLVDVKLFSVNQRILSEAYVVLPPPHVRRSIVTFLDAHCKPIDEAIYRHRKAIDKLDEYWRVIVSNSVTKGLDSQVPLRDSGYAWIGSIPSHWKVMKLSFFSTSVLGKMLDQGQETGINVHRYLSNKDVQWFRINTEALSEMSFPENSHARYGLQRNDILICEGGEVGRCAIWEKNNSNIYFQEGEENFVGDSEIIALGGASNETKDRPLG